MTVYEVNMFVPLPLKEAVEQLTERRYDDHQTQIKKLEEAEEVHGITSTLGTNATVVISGAHALEVVQHVMAHGYKVNTLENQELGS